MITLASVMVMPKVRSPLAPWETHGVRQLAALRHGAEPSCCFLFDPPQWGNSTMLDILEALKADGTIKTFSVEEKQEHLVISLRLDADGRASKRVRKLLRSAAVERPSVVVLMNHATPA